MLAIQYKHRVELYNWFGCYQRGSTKVNNAVKTPRTRGLNDVLVLPPEQQDIIHNILKASLIKKDDHFEFIVRADIVAYLIMGKEITMNIKDKQVQGQIELRYTDIIQRNDSKKPDESCMFRSVVKLRQLIRNATKGQVVKLVQLDDMTYSTHIPKYISLLMGHFAAEGHLHTIPTVQTKALETDVYYIRMFRMRVMARSLADLRQLKPTNAADFIVIPNVSNVKDQNDIDRECHASGYECAIPLATELIFTNNITLLCMAPLAVMHYFLRLRFSDIFQLCMLLCRRQGFETKIFPPGAILETVRVRTDDIRSINATIVCDKIDKEVKALTKSNRVNIIMIGNKGEGKSTASKNLAEMLERKYSYKVKCFSSDSYGRWLSYLCDKYHITHPNELSEKDGKYELTQITQESEAVLDVEDSPSWYETQASLLLMKYGITAKESLIDVINRRTMILTKLKNEFKEQMIERMEAKSVVSFGAYFDALQSAAGENRISIFECHTTEESKQVARSDITFRLEPISSGIGNLLERQRGTLMNTLSELFLYTVYEDQIGSTNPGVYLSEMIQLLN